MSISIAALNEAIQIKEEIAELESRLEKLLGNIVLVEEESSIAAPVKKRRRKMSAAGRARIAAAQKARWAKLKAK